MLSDEDLSGLALTLSDDVTESYLELRQHDCQRYRRAFIRALFAMVEGQTYIVKQRALELAENEPALFSTGEVALLREETYYLERGEVIPRPQFLSPDENLLFALRLCRKDLAPEYKTAIDSVGWQAFKEAIKVRNRITHPKDGVSLAITDAELEKAHCAFEWFFKNIIQTTLDRAAAIGKKLQEKVDKALGLSPTD